MSSNQRSILLGMFCWLMWSCVPVEASFKNIQEYAAYLLTLDRNSKSVEVIDRTRCLVQYKERRPDMETTITIDFSSVSVGLMSVINHRGLFFVQLLGEGNIETTRQSWKNLPPGFPRESQNMTNSLWIPTDHAKSFGSEAEAAAHLEAAKGLYRSLCRGAR